MGSLQASLLFILLLALALFGSAHRLLSNSGGSSTGSVVTSELLKGGGHETLFVLVHGFRGDSGTQAARMDGVQDALQPYGDVLRTHFPAWVLSNTDPQQIAEDLGPVIGKHAGKYTEIVLVGHSIGALILRRAFLEDSKPGMQQASTAWSTKVNRMVLLAGMNRGWDVSDHKPSDMFWYRRAYYWLGAWFGGVTDLGRLIRDAQVGTPFVANLRIDWLKYLRDNVHCASPPKVVQILGDIDDMVSDDDNKDLRVAAGGNFVWLKVRGTGHSDVIDLKDDTEFQKGFTLGRYRADKIVLAATKSWGEVLAQNEEQNYQVDKDVTHIVFVLHGIRDLGEWAANFEQELQNKFRSKAISQKAGKLAVVSVRYGYFGMGQFLLQSNREKYVRWFVDQYTETLARYPNAAQVDFFGHSNGTYLFATALQKYKSMSVDNVVFAGSVVPKNYQWSPLLTEGRIKSVRNYVARDDWVVALFPRFFEAWGMRSLDSSVGSAGFNGFEDPRVENVNFIEGGHSAFQKRVREIAAYLVSGGVEKLNEPLPEHGIFPERGILGGLLKGFSDWAVAALWFGLVVGVWWVGARVVGAAGQPAWPLLLAYLTAVVLVLRWV
jgi:pimeloyl-ACP methyl ester carboxylesterase